MSSIIPHKQCSKCKELFPQTPEFFHRCPANKDGLSYVCKGCKHGNGWKEVLPEGMRRCKKCEQIFLATETYFPYYELKRGTLRHVCHTCCRADKSQYYAINRDTLSQKAAKRYQSNPEPAKQRAKKRYQKDPKRSHEYTKKWNAVHPDARKATIHRSYLKYPERVSITNAKRRARLANAVGVYTAEDVRIQIKAQTDKRGILHCWWCDEPIEGKYHIDHRIPLEKGGSNDAGNICIAHEKCNLSKGAKMPWEYNGRLL